MRIMAVVDDRVDDSLCVDTGQRGLGISQAFRGIGVKGRSNLRQKQVNDKDMLTTCCLPWQKIIVRYWPRG